VSPCEMATQQIRALASAPHRESGSELKTTTADYVTPSLFAAAPEEQEEGHRKNRDVR